MADNTLAENVAQAISDFGALRDKEREYVNVPAGTPTCDYPDYIENILTEAGKAFGNLPAILPANQLKKIPFAFNTSGWGVVDTPFRNSPRITEIEVDLTNVTFLYMLINHTGAKKVTIRNMSKNGKACNMHHAFFQVGGVASSTIEEIYGFNPTYATSFEKTFAYAAKLRVLELCGTIKINGFDVSASTLLTRESVLGIIDALEDKSTDTSGTQWCVTIGAANRAKLTAEELETAADKGWTVV